MEKIIIIAVAVLLMFVTGCGGVGNDTKSNHGKAKTTKVVKQYTCTMHPDVLKDKPGLCPKCGMELVEKDNN